MAFNVGVNVVEVDGRAAPAIAAAPTSVAGFLVRSVRGVPHLPVQVFGFGDFVRNFGGYMDTAFGAHAVRGFFDNGGSEAYVVRVARANALAASATLADRDAAPAPALRVAAGARGREDPGDWGESLSVAVQDHPRGSSFFPAQIAGSAVEPFPLANAQTLSVTVNGGAAAVVTFDQSDFANIASASAAEVAAAINRQTTAFRAGVAPDRRLLLSSASPGANSRLDVAGTAAAALGFNGATANSDGALAAGAAVAVLQGVGGFLPGSAARFETRAHRIATGNMQPGIAAGAQMLVAVNGGAPQTITFQHSDFVGTAASITPGEVVAAIRRQADGFTADLTFNNRLVLLSNRYGPTSTITAAAPAAGTDARVALGIDTAPNVPGTRQYRVVEQVSEPYKYVTWSPGLTAALPAAAARVQTVEFDLVVSRGGGEVERFESLSMQDTLDYYVEAVVNDPDRGSGYVTVADLGTGAKPGMDAPAELRDPATGRLLSTPLAGGDDGGPLTDLDYVGDPAQRTGLHALDSVDVQLLACPETTSPGVVAAALSYCEARGDAMFVGTAPRALGVEEVKTYAAAFRGRKVYGALYAPWIQIVNPLDESGANPRLWAPPVGHVLGVYARLADARGVWKAPAGDEARLRGALGVEYDMTDVDHTDLVKNGSVNGVRAVPGAGVIVDASRTLSTDTRWLFVNVRRLFNFVKVSLRDGLRFVAQEPHTEELRRMVKFNVVTPFLLGLWRRGAFGSDPAEDVFTVVCGPENNPPAEVNLGNFRVEVYFYPVKPAETVVIVVGQQESAASASES